MYCRNCQYDLRGLDIPRCPECGTTFNRADRHSYLETLPEVPTPAEQVTTWMVRMVWIAFVMFILAAIAAALIMGPQTAGGSGH